MSDEQARPEERDSLVEIEKRLDAQYGLNGPDARTLVAMVKELRGEADAAEAMLLARWESVKSAKDDRITACPNCPSREEEA